MAGPRRLKAALAVRPCISQLPTGARPARLSVDRSPYRSRVLRACLIFHTALILRSHSGRDGVSKDASGGAGDHWSILRDTVAQFLRMRDALLKPALEPHR